MTQPDIAHVYGPQADDPSPFTRKCRLLQSWYRVEKLKQSECGLHTIKGRLVGSTLVRGEESGANFLTLAARACAWEKLAEKQLVNPDLTVDRYRLFNNMLSSQPMCFNLFADLRLGVRHGDVNAREVVAAMFRELPIAKVDRVEIEVVPQPIASYINDRTGFDAAVYFTDRDRRPGLASIETKYTDKLGENEAKSVEQQKEKARQIGLLAGGNGYLPESPPFGQIVRNLLLTVIYAEQHQLGHARNYVVAPAGDEETPRLVHELRSRLAPKYRDAIAFLSLEEVVDRGLQIARGTYRRCLQDFRSRYLDFSPIEHLLSND